MIYYLLSIILFILQLYIVHVYHDIHNIHVYNLQFKLSGSIRESSGGRGRGGVECVQKYVRDVVYPID
jgi:hypothetical protein